MKKFNLQEFVLRVMETYAGVLKMLMPTYSKRLCKVIFDYISKTYLLMVITLSTQYSPKEVLDLVSKLKQDKSLFKELFISQLNVRDIEESCKFIDIYGHCLRDRIEEIPLLLVPLAVKLDTDFNDNVLVISIKQESHHETSAWFHKTAQRTILPNHGFKNGCYWGCGKERWNYVDINWSQTKSHQVYQSAEEKKSKQNSEEI